MRIPKVKRLIASLRDAGGRPDAFSGKLYYNGLARWLAASHLRRERCIVHLVLREIVADVDPTSHKVTLVLHWAGGRHSEVSWTKNPTGFQGRSDVTAEEVIGRMATAYRAYCQGALSHDKYCIQSGTLACPSPRIS
jgi:hypothetical protein